MTSVAEQISEVIPIVFDENTAGDHTFYSNATNDKVARVVSYKLTSGGTTNIQFKDSGPNNLTGVERCEAGGPHVVPPNFDGWTDDAAPGEDLILNMGSGVQLGGIISIVLVG